MGQPDEAAVLGKCLHVCMLGDPGVGASSFLRCYRDGGPGPEPGPEIESLVAMVELDGQPYGVRLTDNVAKTSFDRQRSAALGSSHVVLLCFAVDRPETLQNLAERWLQCLAIAGLSQSPGCGPSAGPPLVLVGLRGDRRGPEGCVSESEATGFAEACGARGYFECSTQDVDSIHRAVDEALALAKDHYGGQWREQPSTERPQVGSEEWLEHERQNAGEDTTPLEQSVIKAGLSMLGRTRTNKHAWLRVDVPDMALTSIDAMRPYELLQFVNVSRNQLRTLEPLGALRGLLHLNASFNLLVRSQSFTPPDSLETCDMSYNLIGELGDWHTHRFLRELNLRGNFIDRIGTGLKGNRELRMLDMSENYIGRIENLEGLDLRTLYLAQNQLVSLDGISTLSKLQALNIRHNNITSIASLRSEDLPRLRRLNISDNRLGDIHEVASLAAFTLLQDLRLAPNPVDQLPHYRAQVLHRLPLLRTLDASVAAPEEKVKADLIYGADIEERRKIFENLLPEETFVDRRLVTEELIAEEETQRFGQRGFVRPLEAVYTS
mmetsp:Transcript_77131/g.200982  ORF Transcript_77131/g.200982 Transcript_77131/m.200982 type:complete len:550 (-) Transcript_77131:290-1939(-)